MRVALWDFLTRVAHRDFLTRVARRVSNREIARALGNAFRSGGILPPTGVANWKTVAWASARATRNHASPKREIVFYSPLAQNYSLAASAQPVAWASALATQSHASPTRQRGIFCSNPPGEPVVRRCWWIRVGPPVRTKFIIRPLPPCLRNKYRRTSDRCATLTASISRVVVCRAQ